MEGKADTAAQRQALRIERLAWFLAFALPLILATLLLGARSAAAAVHPPALPAAAEEFAEEEDLAAECELAEAEFEAGEIDAEELAAVCDEDEEVDELGDVGPGPTARPACPLRSARARAVLKGKRLKLTIGYTTSEPLRATIQLRRGRAKLGSFKRQLRRSGVLRFSVKLGRGSRGRISARFKLPSGSAGCPSRRLVLFPRRR